MMHLNEVQKARAVALIESGRYFRVVAMDLHVSPSVVHRLWTRFRETGGYTRRAGQGRKRKTTPQQDRFLVISVLRRRTSTARDLLNDLRMANGVVVSDETVRRRLRESN